MSISQIDIRPVALSEIETLCRIASETFRHTYAAYNTPENMRDYVATYFNAEKIKKELSHPEMHYFFAVRGEEIIGYIKLNEGSTQTESKFPNTMEIERIYVLPEEHGKGYGATLLSKAIEVTKKKNFPQIWLGVWDKNTKAIAFYEKMGFYKDGIHLFVLGDELQRDYLMKLDL
ncbi:GNAT family N-acetyltransferase [Parendozoicomonas sp. Alg238-R29]|uniref:GNAT family N-acetyltransferase n=1 Tax=Parendozoicomonas sp. Alg238-R29 TaxID=2993446 RepID=UPI00248F2C81|nr:GNAT family N-acetyltransferase [Parendozoicomonas sp. Alg238-R29]